MELRCYARNPPYPPQVAFLGEIDAVLDNVDGNLHIPMTLNYYMQKDKGGEVKKFLLISTLELDTLIGHGEEISRSIVFLQRLSGIRMVTKEGWVKEYMQKEGLLEENEVELDVDLDFGALILKEEWVANDMCVPLEMASTVAHDACSPKCPMVARALEIITLKDESTWRPMWFGFLGIFSVSRN